jgi:putative pyridoxal-dependent aspartate 1-decarboxylase
MSSSSSSNNNNNNIPSSTKPHSTPSSLEEEEALVVALFRSVAPAPISTTTTQSSSSSSSNYNSTSNQLPPLPTSLSSFTPRSISTNNKRGFEQIDNTLLDAERTFLSSKRVQTEGVHLSDVASRFKKHTIPENEDRKSAPEYVADLVKTTVNDAVHTASPVMIGHMTSSLPYYARPLSRLITTMNQNSVKTETANTVTFLEREALAELHQALFKCDHAYYEKYGQDPTTVLGVFTSGGTISNLTALWVARNRALPDCESVGLLQALKNRNCPNGAVIIGSELLHYSIGKALDVLGLGSSSLIKIPVDESFRAPPQDIEAAAAKATAEGKLIIAIIGLAGSTEAGSFDDLQGLAQVAKKYQCHFHADAAWGGPAIFSKDLSRHLRGVELCDTVTMDGHKQLYVPMGCGLLFFRDAEFSKAVRKTAGYIIRNDSHDLGKFTLEGSRPANAVYLHSNLHIIGARGYELLVDRSARMTRYMADRVRQAPDFELLVDPPATNILLYRAALKRFQTENSTAEENAMLDALNIKLQDRQRLGGRTFVSRTSLRSPLKRHGGARIVALRVVIANPLTIEIDIDHVLEDQRNILRQLEYEGEYGSLTEKNSMPSTTTTMLSSHDTSNNNNLNISPATTTTTNNNNQPTSMMMQVDDIESTNKDGEDATTTIPHSPRNNSYWSTVWAGMNEETKALFHGSEEQFIGSLISPHLQVEEGIFKDPRYEKHLQAPTEKGVDPFFPM